MTTENIFPAKLIYQPVTGFVEQVAAKSAAPGGGSCAALSGAIGTALLVMVTNFTIDKKDMATRAPRFLELRATLDPLRLKLLRLVDDDTTAFTRYRIALKLPERDDSEKAAKAIEIESATLETITVPLNTMQTCVDVLRFAPEIVRDGNPNTISDAASGAEMLVAGIRAASYNVLINLSGTPVADREHYRRTVDEALAAGDALLSDVRKIIAENFGG